MTASDVASADGKPESPQATDDDLEVSQTISWYV